MKINSFLVSNKIQKKEKLKDNAKTQFSDYISNEFSTEVDISSIEQISTINFNKINEKQFSEEKKAFLISKDALQQLEELRDNIASGSISLTNLKNIKDIIANIKKNQINQKLLDIVEQIELRIEVENAKIEQSLNVK